MSLNIVWKLKKKPWKKAIADKFCYQEKCMDMLNQLGYDFSEATISQGPKTYDLPAQVFRY